MGFDLNALLEQRRGENFQLYGRYLNPQLVRVLRSIGFDRFYERGEGAYLYDRDGDAYLDFLSGFGVFALGRAHPVVKDALHQAIEADLPNLVQMDAALLPGLLAERLVARSHDGMGRVFFTNSGAEAVEAALKFARAATGRGRVLFLDHAFHGLTYGALSANGGKEFRKGFGPYLPGFTELGLGDLDALERELRRGDVAAFLVEPIQGKGVNLEPDEYYLAAERLCHEHGALLIVDEVQTGLGRTGRFFAYEHYGIRPDLVTVSKALSGGFVPVGAMICSKATSDAVYSSMDRALVHSSTFKGNQLAMVAGLATLQVIEDEELVDRARRLGESFDKKLAPLIERYELFHLVRGKGLMVGLEFGEPTTRRLRHRYRLLERARKGLMAQLIVGPLFHRHKILTQVAADGANVIKLLPPLIIGEEEVDHFVGALDEVLGELHSGIAPMVEFGRTLVKGSLTRVR